MFHKKLKEVKCQWLLALEFAGNNNLLDPDLCKQGLVVTSEIEIRSFQRAPSCSFFYCNFSTGQNTSKISGKVDVYFLLVHYRFEFSCCFMRPKFLTSFHVSIVGAREKLNKELKGKKKIASVICGK